MAVNPLPESTPEDIEQSIALIDDSLELCEKCKRCGMDFEDRAKQLRAQRKQLENILKVFYPNRMRNTPPTDV